MLNAVVLAADRVIYINSHRINGNYNSLRAISYGNLFY
jgi:hypothetical protein